MLYRVLNTSNKNLSLIEMNNTGGNVNHDLGNKTQNFSTNKLFICNRDVLLSFVTYRHIFLALKKGHENRSNGAKYYLLKRGNV